ncbi:hypothetical protein A9Q84_15335 [Halobacteriovorax marinus]|uniref:OmpA-like domain-containing protein n=1 Tax=Halobacteriovorax marinus TaxID=97084 RepID=A0A1Y5F5C7_9BACT|nr:hypothetical protein A9Q84_15335 [Halobacteriovorax marinus]
MKKLTLITACLFGFNTFAYDSLHGDVFIYSGISIGNAKLSTDVAADGGDKSGLGSAVSIFASYYQSKWMASFGVGYYNLNLKSDTSNVELVTKTMFLDFTPQYRFTNRWSAGVSYQHTLGEEVLAAPSSVLNVNNEQTTNNLAGIVVDYDIPVKSFRMRLGASIHKALDVGGRDLYVSMFRIQLGGKVYNNKHEPVKIVYKNVETVKEVPAQIIILGEQVVNFERGSYKLSDNSELFLRHLAILLKDNPEHWELVRIIGHTDAVGDEAQNQRLSEKRALAFEEIIASEDISKDRIFSLGMGEEKLKSEGTTDGDHQLNRRVEIQFVGKLNAGFVERVRELIERSSLK